MTKFCEFTENTGNHRALYVITTNRVANPGKTPVRMLACGTHVSTALYEQFRNAESLKRQGMPGTDGITVKEV